MPKTLSVSFILCLACLNGFSQRADTLAHPVLWQLKFNPFLPNSRGDNELSLERQQKLKEGFELSAGITFGNGFLETSQNRLFNPDYTAVEERKTKIGYSIKAAYKSFFASWTNSGFFISPQLARIRYNYLFPLVNIDPYTTGKQKENITYNEVRVLLGYQHYFYKGRLSLECYAGNGIKQRNMSFIEEQSYYNWQGQYVMRYGTYTTTRYLLGIYAGLKIGWNIYEKKN